MNIETIKNFAFYWGLPAALIGFVVWLVKEIITAKAKEVALQKENSNLTKENAEVKQEILILKNKISEYAHTDKLLSEFTIDNTTSTLIHKTTKRRYCYPCLITDKQKVELLDESGDNYFRCKVCGKVFRKGGQSIFDEGLSPPSSLY